MHLKSTLVFLCLWFFASALSASAVQVRGLVQEAGTGLPLEGVLVSLDSTRASAVTDEQGAFAFFGQEAGTHKVSFSAEGYAYQAVTFEISEENGPVVNLGIVSLEPEERESGILNKEDFIPTITLSDEDLEQETDNQNISGVLTASRDVFVSAAAFTFGSARFRIRGYDSENTAVFVNGTPFNELENGRVFWSAWGGLNDVTRNRDTEIGLDPVPYTFGGIGGATAIDTRASTQRKQLRATLSASNRSYRYRSMLTWSTGLMDNGWAVSLSASHRWANEGFQPGTFYDSYAYFLSADRKFSDEHLLNLTAFGAPTKRGRAGASTPELYELAGSNYYNPYWGYQNGEKRNSRVANNHQPVLMLRHDWTPSSRTTLTSTVSHQFGRIGSTALDWFDAPDPRPDYYRDLPSFFESEGDLEGAAIIEQKLRNSEEARQVQWDDFYDVNRNSQLTEKFPDLLEDQDYSGRWSQYIIEDRRYDSKEWNFYSNLQHELSQRFSIHAGLSYRAQMIENFKVVEDLLGGDFYTNIDRFAIRDFPNDFQALRSNLNDPNLIVREGDVFGYDYDTDARRAEAWAQGVFSLRKWELFLAGNLSRTSFWRTGNYRNGRFPDDSFGESEKQHFTNYGLKGGVTYKLDGRNYFFANAAYLTRAPILRNAYVSPRTRDQLAPGLREETISTGEAGYLLRSPGLKARASVYYTQFENTIDVVQFYNDLERAFGSLVMTGLGQRHLGTELAIEAKITSSLSLSAVAALGEYFYSSQATGYLYEDDQSALASVNDGFEIFTKDTYVPGRPQNAYTAGIQYRPKGFWFAYLNFNYFDNVWIDYNQVARTREAVLGVDPNSEEYEKLVTQIKGDPGFTVDLFGGKSFKFGDTFLYVNLGVSNILDNQDFITGGFEQLRFDFDVRGGEDTLFQPRYYYLFGRNYFVNLSLRI